MIKVNCEICKEFTNQRMSADYRSFRCTVCGNLRIAKEPKIEDELINSPLTQAKKIIDKQTK